MSVAGKQRSQGFWRQPNKHYRNFVISYTLLALNFLIPAISYYMDPSAAIDSFYRMGDLFGQQAAASESSYIWWILGAGNVLALAFMCCLLLANLSYFFPVLPALVALKGFSSIGFAAVFIFGPHNVTFLGAALFDGITVFAMLWFAIRAHASIGRDPRGLVPASLSGKSLRIPGKFGRKSLTSFTAALTGSDDRSQLNDDVESAIRQVAGASPTTVVAFRLALFTIDKAPLVTGQRHWLRNLSQRDAAVYLQNLENRRNGLLKQFFTLLRTAVLVACLDNDPTRQRLGAYRRDAAT